MKPIGSNGREMSDKAWRNLNQFAARMSVKLAYKKGEKGA